MRITKDNLRSLILENCGMDGGAVIRIEDPNREATKQLLLSYLGSLRALQLWFHSAHNLSKGKSFSGDHVFLYHKIYTEIQEEIDIAIEKSISLTEDESLGCPIGITSSALELLEEWQTPVNKSDLEIAESGLRYAQDYLELVEVLFVSLEALETLSLGMNDFLMSSANTHETYVYLLQQRVKE